MSSSDCIEMDDSFMFNVNMRRDRCLLDENSFRYRCLLDENSFRYPFDEKIHNNFQKILDLVRPSKKIIPCSDEDMNKYNLSFNKDIDNTLNYEDCYTKLLDKVKDKSIEEKIYFLAPYVPYLLAMLNDFIIVYRYEHNISVLDDLRLEKSGEDACRYHSRIVDRLIDEKYAKINELKKYKPEEYQKYLNNWRKENQRIKEIVNEIRSGFLNN